MMLRRTSIVITAAILGASTVSAGSVLDFLSSSCKDTLQSLLSAPSAACLNLGSLALNAVATNKTIPDVANIWLTGVCSSGSCSNSSLSDVVSSVTSGCSEDLEKYGVTGAGISSNVIQDAVLKYYPTVRRIACLRDDGANQLCVPESLSALQSIVGTLDKNDLDLPTLLSKIKTLANSDYKNIACTGCIKQAYNIGAQIFLNADLLNIAKTSIVDTCGSSFVDGKNVTGVSDTAPASQFAAVNQNSSGISYKGMARAGAAFALLSSLSLLL